MQLHIMSRPFSIKHCPPFLQILEPDGHWTIVGAAVVVCAVVAVGKIIAVVNIEISQSTP